jgi:repressor LexA
MKDMTDRQKAILDYIQSHFSENHYWPSIRDIQNAFGFKSTNAVTGHLRALERKGNIARVPGQARAYRLAEQKPGSPTRAAKSAPASANTLPFVPESVRDVDEDNLLTIPIYGAIAAGYPDGVEPGEPISHLQIDPETAGVRRGAKLFALRVRGESMIEAGIQDGDTVILEKGEGRPGDIVAALIDGEVTLKRLLLGKDRKAYLKAENPAFRDLKPVASLSVQGIARTLVRRIA